MTLPFNAVIWDCSTSVLSRLPDKQFALIVLKAAFKESNADVLSCAVSATLSASFSSLILTGASIGARLKRLEILRRIPVRLPVVSAAYTALPGNVEAVGIPAFRGFHFPLECKS